MAWEVLQDASKEVRARDSCGLTCSSRYKKNLKALYIINPTFWVKTSSRVYFQPLVNSKFWNKVIYIEVSPEELVKRLSARLICRDCQAPYHEINSPPKVLGKCDRCGGELYQRPDDSPETVRRRLEVYFAETAPLIDYYRRAGKLVEVNGEQDIEEVTRDLMVAVA